MLGERIRALVVGAHDREVERLAALLDGAEPGSFRVAAESSLAAARGRLEHDDLDVLVLVAPESPETSDEPTGGVEPALAHVRARRPSLAVVVLTRAAGVAPDARALGAADRLELERLEGSELARSLRLGAASTALAEAGARADARDAGSGEGLFDWDLRTGRVRCSDRFAEIVGAAAGDELDTLDDLLARLHESDRQEIDRALRAIARGGEGALERDVRLARSDGEERTARFRAVAIGGPERPLLVGGSLCDVTDVRTGEARLLHEAYHDPLTGLPNRALFLERLGQAVERARGRSSERYAVLALDLDRFQAINEGLGHEAGDQILLEVKRRLSSVLRPGDVLTRTGSDKYAMLLAGVADAEEAWRVAERARAALAPPVGVGDDVVFVTAGIGIAVSKPDYAKPEEVLRDAYTAMHRAKATGAAGLELFDPGMYARSPSRLRLESDLRRAIERDELLVHYQPIVSVATGEIASLEALLRWEHPERGLVPPGHFVPLAEETGLIAPIGSWVLSEACRTIAEWHRSFLNGDPVSVSVNLSARQFADRGLADEVAAQLDAHSVDPRWLKIEITESVIMENTAVCASQLRRLRDLGVDLAIDDFGTGYSSLGALHRLPIQTLKIDRSFVSRMGIEREDQEIVATILGLARSLGMDAVAEGVETIEQLAALRKLECQMGQGFYFSNALDAESAAAWLRASRAAS